ncbi:cytochrome c oxidase assembly factor Coa1 family protein [Winogradskyella sp. 3972H.M.0a.05]|uniref:cytochrome c oxidase assembly factor Coa1 family protein n=1 Tax=Winogradskyella sp. 3972H.M.0a.05 TaxID=2950277 RepID=UPI0033934DBB
MEQHKQKSWFGRNWPWVLPVGGCLIVILLFVFGVGAVIFGATKMISGSEPYEYAVTTAKTNETVINILGDNIEPDGMMSGNISYSNNDGEADITIPIKGSKGEGSVSVKAQKTDGEWYYEALYVTIKETGEQVNLLDKSLEGI